MTTRLTSPGNSTRQLVDALGNVLVNDMGTFGDTSDDVAQVFAYVAYLLPIEFDLAAALTTLLYSGEQTDQPIGLQYLRARYDNPATGTFNRLDPFAGNFRDPQSLHKYLYTHGDPVNGVDPTGHRLMASTLVCVAFHAILATEIYRPSLATMDTALAAVTGKGQII